MAKKVRVNASEYQEKQARRLKASVSDIRTGIMRVTESPAKAAIAQQDALIANFTEAVRSGKWSKNLGEVSLDEWQTKTAGKGVDRIAAGIDAAKDKTIRKAEKNLANVQTVMNELDNIPRGDLSQNIQRMVHNATRMSDLSKK